MKTRHWILGFVLTAIGILASGCAALLVGGAAAAGAGTVIYVTGELRSSEAVSLDRAWDAVQAAMKDMEYAVTDKEKDATTAKLTARGAGDKKIVVSLRKESGTVTRIGIRVGTMGDRTISYQILEKIKSHF